MIHRQLLQIGFALVCLLLSQIAIYQANAELPAAALQAIEATISQEVERHNIPGLSVAVAVDSRLEFAKGFGMADLENSVPAKASTVYRTASIAKAMTAVAVMQQVESGSIDLDGNIRQYCHSFSDKRWTVTPRQLLGHLGGVRHYRGPQEAAGKFRYDRFAQAIALFADDPLLHEPGTKFYYTTYGYCLLGRALETASGMSFAEYMRKLVFQSADMRHTQVDDSRAIIPNRARGYMRRIQKTDGGQSSDDEASVRAGDVFNADLHDTSMKVPGGGLVSTAPDLVKFGISVRRGDLVKPETVRQMWTEQKTLGGDSTGYGLGWQIGHLHDDRLIGHSGGQAGTSTYLAILPDRELVIGLMSNLQGVSLKSLAASLAQSLISSLESMHLRLVPIVQGNRISSFGDDEQRFRETRAFKAAEIAGIDIASPLHPNVIHRFHDGRFFFLFYKTLENATDKRDYVVQRIRKTTRDYGDESSEPSSTSTTYQVEAIKTIGGQLRKPDQHFGLYFLGSQYKREIIKEFEIGLADVQGIAEGDRWPFDSGRVFEMIQPYGHDRATYDRVEFSTSKRWTIRISFDRGGNYSFHVDELGIDVQGNLLAPVEVK